MDFKVDDLCDFTDLMRAHKFTKKVNIISISLFKMEQGYKNFEKYLSGLELICRVLPEKLKKLKIVLFIDDSIINEPEVYNRIKKIRDLILIKYTCPKFIKNSRHIELFGTLIRFLPFFEFEGNFTNIVMSIDADTNMDDINYIVNDYKYFKSIDSVYHYNTNMFYELLTKWASLDGFTILAGRHMCKAKLPINLLLDYLDCIRNSNCGNMELIKSKMDFTKYSTFPYGIDEYFLNYIMLPYIKKQNYFYSVTVRYNIVAPFYYLVSKNIPENSPMGLAFKSLLESILNKKANGYKQLFKEFDRILYIQPNTNLKSIRLTTDQALIASRFYESINKLSQNKDYTLMKKITFDKILKNSEGNYLVKNNIYVYQGNNLKKVYLIDKI